MHAHLDEQLEAELGVLNELVDAVKADEYPSSAYLEVRRNLFRRYSAGEGEGLGRLLPWAIPGSWWGRLAVAGATLAAVTALVLNPLGGGAGQVFAAVVESLRDAVTISFSAEWYFDGHDEPTTVGMAFRKPGLQRLEMEYQGEVVVQINDTIRHRGLTLIPAQQGYFEMDLRQMPSTERERVALINQLTDGLASLPKEAEEVLSEQVIAGRPVRGYRVGGRTLWIDEERRELVRMEVEMGGARMVMSEFRFDPPDLDETLFSITPPEGYVPTMDGDLAYDVDDVGEDDLTEFLGFMAQMRADGQFPAMVNPMEVLTLQERGLMREFTEEDLREAEENGAAFARASQRAVMFVMAMRPDNLWQYAGEGVVLGAADTPIAWWKPSGSRAYRVVWGDLAVSDEADWQPPEPTE